jgi:hypothetical protein
MTELEEAELTDGQGRAVRTFQQGVRRLCKAPPEARVSCRENGTTTYWRTRSEQNFRMTRLTNFRMRAGRFQDHEIADDFGWGARTRTWEWRNQNPPISVDKSASILNF